MTLTFSNTVFENCDSIGPLNQYTSLYKNDARYINRGYSPLTPEGLSHF
jgi:hypothetical protein